MMFRSIIFVVSVFSFAVSATSLRADIISAGSSTIQSSVLINGRTSLPWGDTFDNAVSKGPFDVNDGTSLTLLTYDLTGSLLTIAHDNKVALSHGLTWTFDTFTFSGGVGDEITSVTQQTGATASSNSLAINGLSFEIETDAIESIGPHQYTFDITLLSDATAAVPEPSTFAMLFAGGLGLFARRRRQKKAVA
jgi:hypothetical protein